MEDEENPCETTTNSLSLAINTRELEDLKIRETERQSI